MPSSSKIDAFVQRGTTVLQLESLVAPHVLEGMLRELYLALPGMTLDQADALLYMRRLTRFSTATERILLELLSTSPENPATPARS